MPNPQTNHQLIRLNKYLAERLGVSRREADELISAGKITVDNQPASLGNKIDSKSKVCYNNKLIPFANKYVYLAFNKPVGYVCSRRAQGPSPTLYELLPKKYQHLKTVGRLDKDSSGLILLTNDGDFAYQMTHPKFRKEKIYEVELDHPLEPLHQQMISDYGVMLDDGPSKFLVVRKEEPDILSGAFRSAAARELARSPRGDRPLGRGRPLVDGRERRGAGKDGQAPLYTVVLTEGRNRQIRRTFAALGYRVTKLHRTSFGKYQLGNLETGSYQEFKK